MKKQSKKEKNTAAEFFRHKEELKLDEIGRKLHEIGDMMKENIQQLANNGAAVERGLKIQMNCESIKAKGKIGIRFSGQISIPKPKL